MNKRLRGFVFVLVVLMITLIAQTALAASEAEPNGSYSEATSISVNTDCYGNLNTGYDYDWYKFELSQPGYVTLRFSQTMNSTSDATYFNVYLKNSNSNTIVSANVQGSQPSVSLNTVGLPAGTYYIQVSSSSWSPAQYCLNAAFTAASNWETESNNYYNDADPISVNSTYYGTLQTSYDTDWYRFELTKAGRVQLKFTNSMNSTSDATYFNVSLKNSDNTTIVSERVKGSQSGVSLNMVGLPAGVYYVYVDSSSWSPAKYGINVAFAATSYWETEFNNTYDAADPISVNKTYYGALQTSYDSDWYRIKLTEAGYLRLKFIHTMNSTSDGRYFNVYLKNSNTNTICMANVIGSKSGISLPAVGLPAGVYYVKIESSNWSPAKYSVTAQFTASSNWETEPNEHYEDADPISVNGTYYGTLRTSYDTDWYKFKLSSSKAIKLGFTHSFKTTSDDTYFRIVLKDGSRNTINDLLVKGSTQKSVLDAGTLKAGTYYVVVQTYSSAWTSSTYTVKVVSKPGVVASLKGVSANYKSVKLTWAKASGVNGYEVYRATSKTGKYSKVGTVASGSTTAFTNTSLTTGKTYYYKVRAYRTAGSGKMYGGFSSVIAAKPVPAKPSGVKAARASSSSIKISWGKVAGANGYEIYRATSSKGKYSKITTITKSSTVSYTNKSLTAGKTYYYKVRAYRIVSGKKVYGGFASVVYANP